MLIVLDVTNSAPGNQLGTEMRAAATITNPVTLSVVVPVYAGADFLEELANAVETIERDWVEHGDVLRLRELIFVDDASSDGSAEIIDRLAEENPWIVPIHLSRNYGQHAATIAGILYSAGDWVVTMDEDLQHPPGRIADLLLKAVRTEADVVYADAASGVHEAAMRDGTSRLFKRMMQWLTDNPKLRHFNSFRLIRGSIARATASVCAHDTYFDISLSWFTQRIEVQSMELKDERFIKTGKSGYNLRSLFSHAWRMIFSSQIKLLRYGALLGFGTILISVAGISYVLFKKILFPEAIDVQGWPSLILAISFFGGLISFMTGIGLQYLSTLVLKAHGKPTFHTVDRSQDIHVATWLECRSR